MRETLKLKGEYYSEKYGESIYHYTNFDALFSILNDKELWFGSTESMNDKSEVVLFIDLLEKALSLEKEIDKNKLSNLFNKIRKSLKSTYPYALCFSKAKDDASQWERYARNASGVCISFNTANLIKTFLYANGMFNEVFYDFDVKEHDHYKILKTYLVENELYSFHDIDGLISNIILCGYFHKHKSFSAEQEIRISSLWDMKLSSSKLEIKCINGAIRKIMIINLEELCRKYEIDFEDLFDEIIIGPRSIQNLDELKDAIRMLGYIKLAEKVRISDCPLR